ncbi:hypothetical protein, partial [Sinorhizobium medicae]|uniref:hypothetical protein n=1 Tax=Sinorhizobium medicae TaxID=110321 RepID=UPI001AECE1FB
IVGVVLHDLDAAGAGRVDANHCPGHQLKISIVPLLRSIFILPLRARSRPASDVPMSAVAGLTTPSLKTSGLRSDAGTTALVAAGTKGALMSASRKDLRFMIEPSF